MVHVSASTSKRGRPDSMDTLHPAPMSKMVNNRNVSLQEQMTPLGLPVNMGGTALVSVGKATKGREEKGKRRPPRHWSKEEVRTLIY